MNRRRKVFDKHLVGFELTEAAIDQVKKKLGKPAREVAEEKVTVLEYENPSETSIARFKKVQFIFFDGLLLNVSYVEPDPRLTRAALHKVLGQPDLDESDEDDGDDDEDDGLTEIFDVQMESEPLLSFAVHYDADENVEALSLCAEVSEDALDDDADGDDDEAEADESDDEDDGDEDDDGAGSDDDTEDGD